MSLPKPIALLVSLLVTLTSVVPAAAGIPVLTPISQVQNPTNTPVFVFNSTEAGTITYNANCPGGGETTTATPPADTTITFDNTIEGTYSENAGAVGVTLSADELQTIDELLPPGAAEGLRFPEEYMGAIEED